MIFKKQALLACLVVAFQALTGQIGIGNTAPSEALDLENSTAAEVDLGINNISTGDPIIHFQVGGTTYFTLGVDNSDSEKLKIGTSALETTTSITVLSTGEVGIQDDNPAYPVEVNGNTNLSGANDIYRIGTAHVLSIPNTKNLYLGEGAGAQNNSAGTDNTYVGYQAGYSSTNGDYNVAIGNEASYTNTAGTGNVTLGYQAGYSSAMTNYSIRIGSQTGYGATAANTFYLDNSSTTNPLLYVARFSDDDLFINGGLIVNEQSGAFDFRVESDNQDHMLYSNASNDYLMVKSNNNVTNRQLQVNSTTSSAGLTIAKFSTDADAAILAKAKSRGTEGAPSIVLDNDVLGPIKFACYDGNDWSHTGATIEAKVNGTPGSNDMPTEIRFQTVPDGSTTQQIRMVIEEDGAVGINQTSPTSGLRVDDASTTVATFNRTTDDGVLLDFRYAGSSEGSIDVSGTTLTYNAFTGAHFANSNQSFEYGKVMVLNGDNANYHGYPNSEILYGIDYSTQINDKRVLGAYSGLIEPTKEFSLDNPHQVMAVGNGKLWVTNEGGNIQIGDYLITSSSQGMAMKDNAQFATSYVCARATEKVNWKRVKADENGVKKLLINVLYESFEVENNVKQSIEKLEESIEGLKKLAGEKYKI